MPKIDITWDSFIRGVLDVLEGRTVQIIVLVAMLLMCFFGVKLFNTFMGFVGLSIGIVAGYFIPMEFFNAEQLIGFVSGLMAGIFLMLILGQAESAGTFGFGFTILFFITHIMIGKSIIVSSIIGVIFGVIAFIFSDFVRIYITAVLGGVIASYMGIIKILKIKPALFVVAAVILSIIGILIQRIISGEKENSKKRREERKLRIEKKEKISDDNDIEDNFEDDFIEFEDLSSSADREND